MLVPQPGGGESTNSQYEKKEAHDILSDEKQKKELMMSPHYEIPVKNTQVKRQIEFAQTFNLRKQHTTTGVQKKD